MWSRPLTVLLVLYLAFLLPSGHPVVAQTPTADAPRAVSSEDAHAALQQVLSRGEFRDYRPKEVAPGSPNRLGRMLDSLRERFFGKLFRTPPPPLTPVSTTPGVPVVTYLFYIILGAIILFMLGLLTSRLLMVRRIRATEKAQGKDEESPVARGKEVPTSWERSLQQAQVLWASGDQREAMRLVYRACLGLLDARGILRYDSGRANGEVLRELRRLGKGQLQQALRPIVRSFDRSWYGLLPVSSDEFAATVEQTQQFRSAVIKEERHA